MHQISLLCYIQGPWAARQVNSPNFASLHLRHNSFSNPSVALPTSQLILQSFRCFTYVTVHSPTLLLLFLCTNSSLNSLASRNLGPLCPRVLLGHHDHSKPHSSVYTWRESLTRPRVAASLNKKYYHN